MNLVAENISENISEKVSLALLRHFDRSMVSTCNGNCFEPKLEFFYHRLYENKKEYMLSSDLRYGSDKHLLGRSTYYYVEREEVIVAAARFTSYPFECGAFYSDMQLNPNYIEISRLGMLNQSRRFNPAMLIVIAGVKEALVKGYEGIYALVRRTEISQFKRYGLDVCSVEVDIPERDAGQYVLMSASKYQLFQMTESVADRIVNYQKRSLLNLTNGEENVSVLSR